MRCLWLLVLSACSTTYGYTEYSAIDAEFFRGAVCRIKPFGGGHGSGVAIKREENKTYILTARHVVAGQENHAFVIEYSKDHKDYIELAFFDSWSNKDDLALLVVRESSLNTIALASKHYQYFFGSDELGYQGNVVIAVGFMEHIYPPVVSVGRADKTNKRTFEHSAAGFFGSSGGPVLDALEGSLVGITVRIYVIDDVPRSDRMIAVNIQAIYEFLEAK